MNVRVLSMCLFWLRRLAISGSVWHPRALWALIRPLTVQLAEVGFPYFSSDYQFMCLQDEGTVGQLHVRFGDGHAAGG